MHEEGCVLHVAQVGAFWFNPTETFVDVEFLPGAKATHWISESGVFDLMLMPGPRPKHVLQQFTQLVSSPLTLAPNTDYICSHNCLHPSPLLSYSSHF